MTRFAVAQMNSQDDIAANLATVERLLQQAQTNQAQLLVLPENVLCFAPGKQQQTAAQFEYLQQQFEQLSHRYGLWLIAGTLPCPFRPDGSVIRDGRVRTSSLCISPEGTVARYDKIHLFDVQVDDAIGGYQESKFYEPGDTLVVAHTPFAKIGMMVCYDLRFPELAITLRAQGAEVLSAPSAFTFSTGQMHWQLLLQARALDSQCAVLGAAQGGWHGALAQNPRQTWGHATATNCKGQVLGHIQQTSSVDGSGLLFFDFDAAMQQQFREAMPLITHRRLMDL